MIREQNKILISQHGRLKHQPVLAWSLRLLSWCVHLPLLESLAMKSAVNIAFREVSFWFSPDLLPAAFDNYKILQLSDLHLDLMPDFSSILNRYSDRLSADLLILTGDYKDDPHLDYEKIRNPLAKLLSRIKTVDGSLAVLGNHDSHHCIDFLGSLGVRVLVNESVSVMKKNQSIGLPAS